MRSKTRVHQTTLRNGITRSKEFEKKGLAAYAINVGTKCGHGCLYCSTGAMLRTHRSFRCAGESPYGTGFAIVDPSTPERVTRDARRKRERGMVELCTYSDAWSPEAQEHDLGRRCLEAILSEPDWSVRILTKNAAVLRDFDVVERHRDRVLVGLSLTGTPDKSKVLKALEPNASTISKRMAALQAAHARGLRTYAMLCPLLPGISDSPEQIDELVRFSVAHQAEEIFAEPVNPRGPGIRMGQEALQSMGALSEAAAIGRVRGHRAWSEYVLNLTRRVQSAVRRHYEIRKLRFLLYPSGLGPEHRRQIRKNSAGVVWL